MEVAQEHAGSMCGLMDTIKTLTQSMADLTKDVSELKRGHERPLHRAQPLSAMVCHLTAVNMMRVIYLGRKDQYIPR